MTALSASKASSTRGCAATASNNKRSERALLARRPQQARNPAVVVAGGPRRRPEAQVCRAATDDQARQMDAQMRRLEAQVTEGKIKAVNAAEVGNLLEKGWVVLDVRPPNEVDKGKIDGAVQVPLFVVDDDTSPGGLLKQMSAFGMGGWWLGNRHMKLNTKFMGMVRKGIPTDANVIVACQKGLRSLSACEQLAKNGYAKVAWVTGGLDTAEPGDLPVAGGKDIRFAGNGGVSNLVGWTEAHRKANKEQSVLDGPFGIVLKIALGILGIDFVTFLVGLVTGDNSS